MTCSQTALWCELEVPSTPPDTGERCQHRHLVVLNLCRDLPRTPRVEAAAFKGTFGNVCPLKYYFTTKKNVGQESSFHMCGYIRVRLGWVMESLLSAFLS